MATMFSRRRFLRATAAWGAALAWPRGATAATSATIAHSESTFIYGLHMIAKELKYFEAEELDVPAFLTPGGGAKVVQALAAGQVQFALGDSNHPLKITQRGRDAVILFATDRRCSYANVLVRQDLYDKGVSSIAQLADPALVGRRAMIACTAIGSGTQVYGAYLLKSVRLPDKSTVNEHVDWLSAGGSTTSLGGLKAHRFDATMAVPEWQWAAQEQGFGRTIFDVNDEKQWNATFGGPIPATVAYTLARTVQESPDLVQRYVNACYRAQLWMAKAKPEAIVDLIHKSYMASFPRAQVLKSVNFYRGLFNWGLELDEPSYQRGMKVWVPDVIPQVDTVPRISLRSVSKTFQDGSRDVQALTDVSFDVAPGEFVALIGPSGCGKSTVLNAVAGLAPAAGAIRISGEPVTGIRPEVGYVFQKDTVFPWRTVADNLAVGLEYRRLPRAQIQERVAEALHIVGLSDFADAYPATLSGGMRQRVALMRTLIVEPAVLLLDEPFGALDAHTKMALHAHLLKVCERVRPSVLLVTHDLAEAVTLADRVMVMTRRPGRIRSVHAIGLSRPRDPYTLLESREYHELYARIWKDLGAEFKEAE
jgi:NitT/TauT family transport system ATP-binding protein